MLKYVICKFENVDIISKHQQRHSPPIHLRSMCSCPCSSSPSWLYHQHFFLFNKICVNVPICNWWPVFGIICLLFDDMWVLYMCIVMQNYWLHITCHCMILHSVRALLYFPLETYSCVVVFMVTMLRFYCKLFDI